MPGIVGTVSVESHDQPRHFLCDGGLMSDQEQPEESYVTESPQRRAKRLKEQLETRRSAITEPPIKPEDWLSCGSTLTNLCASETLNGAFCKGRYFFYVGESSGGKSFLALNSLAEASINPNFDKYRLIYDNAEDGALMSMEKFFGKRMASRLEPPKVDENGGAIYSRLAEEFYYNLFDNLKKGPCIYVLDSMDSLDTVYADKKFMEHKTAHQKPKPGVKPKGDYGDGKAKINSQNVRKMIPMLQDTGSILIVICQSRDNIDGGMFDPDEVFSGGRAIKFYAGLQIWVSKSSAIKKTVHGQDRQVGQWSRVTIKKNRITGKEWSCKLPIYWSTGIDDTGSIVEFLVTEKHWKASQSGIITAPELDLELPREELIQHIEAQGKEKIIKHAAKMVFADIVEQCKMTRKNRYE